MTPFLLLKSKETMVILKGKVQKETVGFLYLAEFLFLSFKTSTDTGTKED
jgi:hypothetical protein